MADLPPRFTTDLEDSLPPTLALPADQHSVASNTSRSTRRWDDPPEDDANAPPPAENPTSMVFTQSSAMRTPAPRTEVCSLLFSPDDTHLSASTTRTSGAGTLVTFNLASGKRLVQPSTKLPPVPVSGDRRGSFAFDPHPAPFTTDPVAACSLQDGQQYRVEMYDLVRFDKVMRHDAAIRAPIAWGGPEGSVLVGVSVREPSRVGVLRVKRGPGKYFSVLDWTVLLGHIAEVTQVAVLPGRGELAVVSAGRDGVVRVTSVGSGRTLKKIEVGSAAAPGLMQVSPDGKRVVTVWGRYVVVWYLEPGRVHSYSMDALRPYECWPLCVSPDCRYLVCRTEEGIDVGDVKTGKFRGEFAWKGEPITAAAVNNDGTRLAVGDYGGDIQTYVMITS